MDATAPGPLTADDPEPRYRVLGQLTVVDGTDAITIGAAKQRSLLAVLLIRANRVVPIDLILDELWDGRPPRTGRNVVQWYLSRLRRLMADDQAPVWQGGGYRLPVAPGDLDAERFEAAGDAGHKALADGDMAVARDHFERALAYWRGPALADVPDTPTVAAEAARLTQRRHAVLIGRLRSELALGQPARLLPELEALAADHPFDEDLHHLFMTALYQSGRVADALGHFRAVWARYDVEMGIEPGPRLRELELAMLNRDPRLDPARAAVFTVRPESSVPPRPSQLPADLPDFVGREPAVGAIVGALSEPSGGAYPPVAAITGQPGVGKSAMAVHVAHLLRSQYPDGQIYLDLSAGGTGTVDPLDALGHVLRSLGVNPTATGSTVVQRAAMVRSLLAGRRVLLVLDNAGFDGQVRALLPNEPGCAVLVTSRWPLAGLTTVPPTELEVFRPHEGVELLARIVGRQRVEAEPDQAARVAELCAGLPLALRIAGTRLAARGHRRLTWLARRLSDERHRLDELVVADLALRRSLDLSYRAIGPEQRRAMRWLALLDTPDFAGWLAAATLDCPLDAADDLVEELLDARLLTLAPTSTPAAPRYQYHQLVRLYARELAEAEDPPPVRAAALRRACGACLALAERQDRGLGRRAKLATSGAERWCRDEVARRIERVVNPIEWFETERRVLVAAVRHSAAQGLHDVAWDLATSLDRFLEMHNHAGEWVLTAEIALAAARHAADPGGEATVMHSLGQAYVFQDRFTEAKDCFTEAVDGFRRIGHPRAEAHALVGLSVAQNALGGLVESVDTAEHALALLRDFDDPAGEAAAWMSLASNHHQRRDLATAEAGYRESLSRYERVGDRMNQSIVLCTLGSLLGLLGRPDEAEEALVRAAALGREIGFRNGEAYALIALGQLKVRLDAGPEAQAALAAALELTREIGDSYGEAMAQFMLGSAHRQAGAYDLSRERLAAAAILMRRAEMRLNLARTLVGLGETEEAAGDPGRARAAWLEAQALFAELGLDDDENLTERLAALAG